MLWGQSACFRAGLLPTGWAIGWTPWLLDASDSSSRRGRLGGYAGRLSGLWEAQLGCTVCCVAAGVPWPVFQRGDLEGYPPRLSGHADVPPAWAGLEDALRTSTGHWLRVQIRRNCQPRSGQSGPPARLCRCWGPCSGTAESRNLWSPQI